jgi:hypothetical protein
MSLAASASPDQRGITLKKEGNTGSHGISKRILLKDDNFNKPCSQKIYPLEEDVPL